MAFGEAQFLVRNKTTARLYGKLVGITDFHSHFRWAAIKQFINFQAQRTLEAGAGTGLMTFEVAKRLVKNGKIIASELDERSVGVSEKIIKKGDFKNVEFIKKDLRALGLQEKFDQVLAIDVLEHIEDDLLALKEINAILETNGRLVISVPTPLYPKYFGKEFAEKIGHMRDGYCVEELNEKLYASGFRTLKYKYYTRFWASLFCSLFYKTNKIPRIKLILLPILKYLALFLDRFSTDAHSSSLAILAEKVSVL